VSAADADPTFPNEVMCVNSQLIDGVRPVRRYDEKLLEEFIRDYPQAFLGEQLHLVHQQATIGGFRPDLIFQDANGRMVIVEVQLRALDRAHLYRTLEYRDLVMQQMQCEAACDSLLQ
jgi:hypothetical protein